MIPTWVPVVFIVLGLPLIFGLIPRNWFYGVRTPRTLAADESWYPVNRVGGVIMLLIGVVWLLIRWGRG